MMKNIFKRVKNPLELTLLLLFFLLALYFFVQAFSFSESARTYPLLTSSVLMVLDAVYTVRLLMQAYKSEERASRTAEEKEQSKASLCKILLAVLCFTAFLVIAYLFGFFVAAVALAVVFPPLFGYRKPLGILVILVLAVAIVVSFQKFLGITLSRGTLLDLTRLFY